MEGHFSQLDLPVRGGLQRLRDPRTTFPFVLACLLLLLFTSSVFLPMLVVGFCLILLCEGGIPLSAVIRRVSFPLAIAAVLLLTQVLTYGHTVLFRVEIGCAAVTGYKEGLLRGVVLMSRVMAGVTLLVFLTSATPVYRLLQFFGRIGMPGLLVLQCLMVYRFSSLLVSEAARIHEAQTIRLGYSSLTKRIRSLQLLGVSMFLRSLDRSGNIYEAARMRGAGTELPRNALGEWEARIDLLQAALFAAAFAVFFLAGRIFHVAA